LRQGLQDEPFIGQIEAILKKGDSDMLRLTCILVSRGLLPVLLLTWMLASAGTGAADGGQADLERLKRRVNEYFSAVHSRQFEKARQFVLPHSREAIDAARSGKARITGFSIVEVELEEGHRSAVVTIRRLVTAPAGSVRVKEKFRWKREDGEWFLDPDDPPKTDSEIFTEYYYKKQGIAPTAEFEERVFDFGLAVQGEPVRSRFSFRNPSSRDLIVEKIHGPDRLITDRTEKRLIPAGAAGEITVELNTAKLHRDFIQDIFVQFEPVKEMVKLRITGRVFTAEEIAKSPSLSKEAATKKSATPENP
jgi:hypothetical protein